MDWATIRAEGLATFTMEVMPPTIQLPALPHAVTLFMERSADEAATERDLAEILETDTGLDVRAAQIRQLVVSRTAPKGDDGEPGVVAFGTPPIADACDGDREHRPRCRRESRS